MSAEETSLLRKLLTLLLALLLAASILVVSTSAATLLRESPLVAQSRVLRMILSDDTVGVLSFLQSSQRRGMLQAFLTAVADAYVNFELIPVNEGQTFVAILTSLNGEIMIDSFQYHRRDLEIRGTGTQGGYHRFVKNLQDSGHFYQIEEVKVTPLEDGQVAFELLCQAAPVHTPTVFPNGLGTDKKQAAREPLLFCFVQNKGQMITVC